MFLKAFAMTEGIGIIYLIYIAMKLKECKYNDELLKRFDRIKIEDIKRFEEIKEILEKRNKKQ